MFKRNKGTPSVPETGKDIPTQGDKLGISCVGSIF